MIVSVGIWAVTGSAYSLLFAVLGPVVAAGSLLDGRRQRRRGIRHERELTLAAIGRVSELVDSAHARERERLDRLAPELALALDPRRIVEAWSREGSNGGSSVLGSASLPPVPVRVGRTRLDAVVELTGESHADLPAQVAEAIRRLRSAASGIDDAPWLVDARDGIGVVGPASASRAVARSLAVQVLAQCSPAVVALRAPEDETWVSSLPHRHSGSTEPAYRIRWDDGEAVIAWATSTAGLPPGLEGVISLPGGLEGGSRPTPSASAARAPLAPPRASHLQPTALGARRAREAAKRLAELARLHGVLGPVAALPENVRLSELLRLAPASAPPGGLGAPIGRGVDGVVELDLVREGPHAVVAGTTGTGKSELLVSWVLAMASRHPVSEVTFLLIDFKGGAAFAPLVGVPHVIGIVSDLDARRSRRAIESLRAELRRRELFFADRGIRSIEEANGDLARLVIVVDEFAAVVAGQPELHDVFADLAARGRSLGLHLVLCTQRPAGVVRDGVLANVTLRISLRVTDRGDSSAMLGSDAAFALPPSPRGRAVIADGTGEVREVQLALADPSDAARLRPLARPESPSGLASSHVAVWCDPLPDRLGLEELRRDPAWGLGPGIPFGRLDLPAEQRQPLATHDPETGGHVLVLGAARAGRTTALATFAADRRCRILPGDPADAWTVLSNLAPGNREVGAELPGHDRSGDSGLGRGRHAGHTVLLIDDLDVLIDAVEPDARHDFVDLLSRLARGSRQLTVIASAQRLTSSLQRLSGLFDARLLLRQPSRDEHVLAGGDGADFDPRLPPGAGSWRSGSAAPATVQVAIGDRPLPPAEPPELPRVRLEPGRPLAVVAGRPREVMRALQTREGGIQGMRVIRLGEESPPADAELRVSRGEPILLLGDPDAWQAEWALLATVRRDVPLVFLDCAAGELRSIAHLRDSAPPLGRRPGECWLVDGAGVHRAILELGDVDQGPPD